MVSKSVRLERAQLRKEMQAMREKRTLTILRIFRLVLERRGHPREEIDDLEKKLKRRLERKA